MQLNPIYPIFHHVKGHQDEKSDWPSLFLKNSTLIAMLKNENLHHICMSQPYSTIPPTKPDIHIYRLLNRLLLNNFRMNYVMHSLNHLTLTTYKPSSSGHVCQRKFHQLVHPTKCMVQMNTATWPKTIDKFIHEWLPLQDHYHEKSTSIDCLCPFCQSATETAYHFLACPHRDCQTIWKDLHQLLLKHFISSSLHDMLVHGLCLGQQAAITFQPFLGTPDLQQLYTDPHKLGCQQLYHYRQFAPTWIQVCNIFYPHLNT